MGLMIPILMVIVGGGVALLAIFLGYRRRKEIFAMYHQERMAAIEKGVDLPPLPDPLLTDDGRPARPYHPRRHLLRGLAWSFVGIGLGLGLLGTVSSNWALFSLVPIGIGLAHLIYYFVEGKKEAEALEREKASQPPVLQSASAS
jgi:hypothetical protein